MSSASLLLYEAVKEENCFRLSEKEQNEMVKNPFKFNEKLLERVEKREKLLQENDN